MRSTLLTLLLLVATLVPLPPPAAAQGTVDVSLWTVELSRPMVVNESVTVSARVNSTGAAVVRATFFWGDNTDLKPGTFQGSDNFIVSEFQNPGTKPFNLTLGKVPFDRRGAQQIRVTVESQGQGDSDTTNNTFILSTYVRHARLNLTFDNVTLPEMVPQGESALRYFVRNDGNFEENATATLDLTPGGPWLVDGYGPLPTIPPGGSATGLVLVRSTSATDARNLSLNVTVQSSVGGEGTVRLQAPNLTINDTAFARQPRVVIEGLAPTVQVFPDENRTIPFLLRNAATTEHVFRVTPALEHSPTGWTVGMRVPPTWQANLTTPVNASASYPVVLRPNESILLAVNVTRAAGAPNATATLKLEVNSTDGDRIAALAGGSYRATATATLTDAGPDLVPTLVAAPATIYQGDVATFRVHVANVGRGNASNATLHLELRDNLRTIEETTLPVAELTPGAAVTLQWSPPTAGLRGAYVLLGRVDANATQLDRNVENNTLRRDLHIRSPVLTVRAPEGLRVVPGGRLVLTSTTGGLGVENLGDREEALLVTLNSTASWLNTEWRLLVPSGTLQPVPLQLDVPALPGVQQVTATLSAHVEGRPRFAASATITVEVDDVETPDMVIVAPSGNGKVGVESRLALHATDASGIRRAEVILRTPGGERVALPLQRNLTDADVYETRHTPFTPGTYLLEFRVEDASGQAQAAAVSNLTWIVDGSSYKGLRPVNFGEGAFVGRAPLRFSEATANTTRSALVDAGSGFLPLPPPYSVQLPLVEGPRLVHVRATALDGTLWEGRWNVTVDLTPPNVTEGTTRDAGDGRIELTVRAEGAEDVLARFQTETGPVEVDLASRGGALFGATVTAPGSWSRVEFVAKDTAGNEGSVQLDAPGRDAPGPGLALVLLGVAVVALALRRRT